MLSSKAGHFSSARAASAFKTGAASSSGKTGGFGTAKVVGRVIFSYHQSQKFTAAGAL